MIRLGHVFCDECRQHLGQLWNLPPVAADALPPCPDFHLCSDCLPLPVAADPRVFPQEKAGGRGL